MVFLLRIAITSLTAINLAVAQAQNPSRKPRTHCASSEPIAQAQNPSHKPRTFAAIMVQLNDQFLSIDAARKAIKAYVLDQGESYKLVASDKKRYIISCKDNSCKFRIRATRSAKEVVSITIFVPHSCSPRTHYNFKKSQSVCYLLLFYTILRY
jgi:MuDR family transposase